MNRRSFLGTLAVLFSAKASLDLKPKVKSEKIVPFHQSNAIDPVGCKVYSSMNCPNNMIYFIKYFNFENQKYFGKIVDIK